MDLRFATFELTPEGALTTFPDGTSWPAHPHDTPHYHYLAYRYGHEGDTLAYARAHELAHHLVAEALGGPSKVVWALAHGEQPSLAVAAAEEALAMVLHRYAMTGEPAMIEGIPWDSLKTRLLEMTQ